MSPGPSNEEVIRNTRHWIETAVIGLHLCPFARAVYAQDLIRYVVSEARSEAELEEDLQSELGRLHSTPPLQIETTLLIHPHLLEDFMDFNQFLDVADSTLHAMNLVGEIQIASFHPHYQFSGTDPDDITNYTNRSPYPILHLLRESSVTQALNTIADPSSIPRANQEMLRRLGKAGWKNLGLG